MNKRLYKKHKLLRRKANTAFLVCMMLATGLCGFLIGGITTSRTVVEYIRLPQITKFEKPQEEVKYVGKLSELGFQLTAGVATVMSDANLDAAALELDTKTKTVNAEIIRCTGYCDYGYTRSGEYVRDGIIAGREEWLGRTCNLYRVNEDNSMGELIGSYQFLDTGYGIKGSLKKGTSVDVWHPSEDSVWDWMAEYGDYVYIEFTS